MLAFEMSPQKLSSRISEARHLIECSSFIGRAFRLSAQFAQKLLFAQQHAFTFLARPIRAAGEAFLQRAVSIPSQFPFRVRLAHCLLTRINCVPEGSWTY